MAFFKSFLRPGIPISNVFSNLSCSRFLSGSRCQPTASAKRGSIHTSQKYLGCRCCPSTDVEKQSFGLPKKGATATLSLARKLICGHFLGQRDYCTKSIFRLTETNAGLIQPVLDIEYIIENEGRVQDAKTGEAKDARDIAQCKRDELTRRVQELKRDEANNADKLKQLREEWKRIREEVRQCEAKFNELNDELVDYIISLPNLLDPCTPETNPVILSETPVPDDVKPWEFPDYMAIESPVGPGYLAEFAVGQSAWMDMHLREKAQQHLLRSGFIETGNAEYVRRLILQGAGMEPKQFLRIREPNVKRGWEHTTYLVGGASFPSFLVLFAQSVIESSRCLPLRYFVIGRSYKTRPDRPGSYQSHNVQAFIACKNSQEMEEEFENMRKIMELFYSTQVGFAFRTKMMPAPKLELFEKKKLQFVVSKTDRTPTKVIGTLSAVGDHVSKRLLCLYFNEKRDTEFMHFVSAQFFDITHFLRITQPTKVDHSGNPLPSNSTGLLPRSERVEYALKSEKKAMLEDIENENGQQEKENPINKSKSLPDLSH